MFQTWDNYTLIFQLNSINQNTDKFINSAHLEIYPLFTIGILFKLCQFLKTKRKNTSQVLSIPSEMVRTLYSRFSQIRPLNIKTDPLLRPPLFCPEKLSLM